MSTLDSLPRRTQGPRGRPRRRAVLLVTLALAAGSALSLPGHRMLGHYDFGYAIAGDRAARPAQVFDDGAGKVFFEARPGQPMPAVFVGRSAELLAVQAEGQFYTARTGESEFTLALGAARATVRRGDAALGPESVSWRADDDGGGRLLASAAPGLPAGIAFEGAPPAAGGRVAQHEQPIVFAARSAQLAREVLDALDALVVRVGRDTAIAICGRDDAGGQDALARRRAEALRNALLARGVPAGRLEIVADAPAPAAVAAPAHPRASTLVWHTRLEGPAGAAAWPAFEVRESDGDVAGALHRWAAAEDYEVVWDLPWSVPARAAPRVAASDFLDAVRQLVTGLRAQGRAVRAQAYSDRVVRIGAVQ